MPSELLSHRLVGFRERHGLTQQDLAELLSVTPRYLIYLENGQKEADPNGGLVKLFNAYESGQIPVNRQRGNGHEPKHASLRDAPNTYKVTRRTDSIGAHTGLNAQEVLSQIRADIAMIEGGTQSEKRRAYHFLHEVHLPMLADMLKLE